MNRLPPLRLWPRQAIILLIRLYQCTLSVWLPPSCRFTPSCSAYTLLAVERFGIIKGSWLGVRRILRCHPFHPGGYDPVPEPPPPPSGKPPMPPAD